jgi:hypothetical protein
MDCSSAVGRNAWHGLVSLESDFPCEQQVHQPFYHFCTRLGPRLMMVDGPSTPSTAEKSSSLVSGIDSIPEQISHLQLDVDEIRQCSLDSSDLTSTTTVHDRNNLECLLSVDNRFVLRNEGNPCADTKACNLLSDSSLGQQSACAENGSFAPTPPAVCNGCSASGDREMEPFQKMGRTKNNGPDDQNDSADQVSDPSTCYTCSLETPHHLCNLNRHSHSGRRRPRLPNQDDPNSEEPSCNPRDEGSNLCIRAKIRERLSPIYKIPGPDRYVRGADKCVKSQRRVLQNRLSGQISRELAREKMIALEREAKYLEDRLQTLKAAEVRFHQLRRRTLAPSANSAGSVAIKA